jgi:hypothetical protein
MGYDEYISNETKGLAKDQEFGGQKPFSMVGLEMDIWIIGLV